MSSGNETKAQSRDAFKQFVENFYQQSLGNISNEKLHEGLTRFYVNEIYNKTHEPIDDDEFRLAYINGPRELGVDFIHKSDQNVLIIQTKFKGKKSLIDIHDILHFQRVFERLKGPEFKKNVRLAEILGEIDFGTDTFYMRFVSFGRIEGQALTQTKIEPEYPFPDMSGQVEWDFLGEDELTSELRNAKSLASGLTGNCELVCVGKRAGRDSIIDLTDENGRSVVMVVGATQLTGLFDKYKSSLFTLNIRNYLGNTATNKLIIETLRTEPKNFYYYNNGISCLADKLEIAEGKVVATNLQVINGAQTVRSLHKASRSNELVESVKQAKVLVRITESPTKYGVAGRFRNSIVRSNNTQNVIELSDFRSNDPIQEDLRAKFSLYRRFGQEVVYLAKRTDPTELRGRSPITMESFAKVVYSFLRDPIKFSGKNSFLFDESENGGYLHVFGDGAQVYSTVMPDSEFKLRSAVWWLAIEFSDALVRDREATTDKIERAALERKWFVIFASRLVIQRSFGGDGYRNYLIKHYRGDWRMGEGQFGKFMAELYRKSKQCVVYRYDEDSKSPDFNHRNWMRSQKTVDGLESFVKRGPGMEITLPEDLKVE